MMFVDSRIILKQWDHIKSFQNVLLLNPPGIHREIGETDKRSVKHSRTVVGFTLP